MAWNLSFFDQTCPIMKKILLVISLILLMTTANGQSWHSHGHKHHDHFHDQEWVNPTMSHRPVPHEIRCDRDFQMLPNGCHVRLWAGSVRICKPSGDKLLDGEEVWLLPSGYYEVYEMDRWRIYDPYGERLFGLSSEDFIRQAPNGYFIYKSLSDQYRVADRKGDDVFGMSGDAIDYVGHGIFRVEWGGFVHYYNEKGERVE